MPQTFNPSDDMIGNSKDIALNNPADGQVLGYSASLDKWQNQNILPVDGSITNVKVAANAAIALSKLATDPLARANHTGTQTSTTISDFAEAARDVIGAALTAGTNITITVNDTSNTISISTNATRVLTLAPGQAVPAGTPDGTIILDTAN